ncbi:MAG: penicillin-binding transpeptidase domain-containing protein [Microgenomates group bacterium]
MIKHDWQEQLILSSHNKRSGYGSSIKSQKSFDTRFRMRAIWAVFVVISSLIIAKILYLQIIERAQHQLTSYSNHVELKREVADRGQITDRRGEVIGKDFATAQVVGYLSEVNNDELGCSEGICYSQGMMIGRSGIEHVMETTLKGKDGGRLVEVDSAGKEIRELGSNEAEKGSGVQLSIDNRLQHIMYQALGGKSGSAVALDMQGKVLGLVSSPSYDPNDLSKYLKDTKQLYFLNRAIAGAYPPGSVFKLVTAHAGLVEGKITSETEYEDTGEIKVGIYRYGNWYFDQYGRTEGQVNLVKALSRSNDIYFYKVGEEIGVEKLVFWSKKFGLGEKTGIELPGERDGLVPDRLYKERITGEKWFLGNTYHMAIGQGDLLVTPVQVARMTLAAVSGRLCNVSLLFTTNVGCSDIGLKTEDLALVREGMRGACAPGGTAFPFFSFDPWVMCKTGTAQHSGQISDSDQAHAWITIAYPGENPEMILTVMLEAAGEGSAEAGPVAKTILDQWKALK